MLRLYAAIHREIEDSLLLECDQGKEEAVPYSKCRERNSDYDDSSSISKREVMEKCRPLPVYQEPRPVVTQNFFALLRTVTMEDAEVCGKTPSSDNNLDKDRPRPTVLTSEVNLLSLQGDFKAVVMGSFSSGILLPVPRSQPKVWQTTKPYRIF
jgi:hypothetical protein